MPAQPGYGVIFQAKSGNGKAATLAHFTGGGQLSYVPTFDRLPENEQQILVRGLYRKADVRTFEDSAVCRSKWG